MVQEAASQSSIVTATDSSDLLVRAGLCVFVFLWSLALLYLY